MKYLLIDTNAWINLLRHEYGDEVLTEIENGIVNRQIQLLVPNALAAEWDEKKQLIPNMIIQNHQKLIEQIGDSDITNMVHNFTKNQKEYLRRNSQYIQRLIDGGIPIPPSEKVDIEVMKRSRAPRKAPFHNNNTSYNDATIYFSAVEYAKQNNICEIHFFTCNYKDFSDPNNKNKLHPDLEEDNVTVNYYLNDQLIKFFLPYGISTSITFHDYRTIFCFDNSIKAKPILEQWYLTLEYYHKQIPYLPIEALTLVYPHSSKGAGADYGDGVLYISNPQLTSFLETVKIEDDIIKFSAPDLIEGVTDAENKMLFIFQYLKSNLVREIKNPRGQVNLNLASISSPVCDCIRCSYHRRDYFTVLNLLKKEPCKDHEENLKQAYVHYQLGNFITAAKFYSYAYQYCNPESAIKKYTCVLNLENLKGLILRHNYSIIPSQEIDELFKNVKREKDLITLFNRKDAFSKYFALFLSDNHYLLAKNDEIDEMHKKISVHYEMQLKGGKSSNSFLRRINTILIDLNNFLSKNCIAASHFTNYSIIIEKVFEAHLMAYAFNEYQSLRLLHFSSSIYLMAAEHLNSDTVLKAYNKYSYQKLKHVPSDGEISIFQVTSNLLDSYKDLMSQFEKKCEEAAVSYQEQKLEEKISTLLTLCAVSEMQAEEIALLSNSVVTFLKQYPNKNYRNIVGFSRFIQAKGKYFTESLMRDLIVLIITNSNLQASGLAFSTGRNALEYTGLFKDQPEAEKISPILLESCHKDHRGYPDDLIAAFFNTLSPEQQNRIKQEVENELDREFNYDQYYRFAIYGFIDYRKYYEQYLEATLSSLSFKDHEHYWMVGEIRSQRFSDLLNLAFSFGIDITAPIFQQFKGQSDYYDWLLDMDNFDYDKFNTNWITAYGTTSYYNKIFNNKKTVSYLINHFKRSNNIHLMRLFFSHCKLNELLN